MKGPWVFEKPRVDVWIMEGPMNFCETMTKTTNNKQKGGASPFLIHHDQDDKQQARKRGEGF